MKKYALNIDDRKVLVSRLMELTGLHSRYTFMPRCAYIVGSYIVEKEGTLVIEDKVKRPSSCIVGWNGGRNEQDREYRRNGRSHQ